MVCFPINLLVVRLFVMSQGAPMLHFLLFFYFVFFYFQCIFFYLSVNVAVMLLMQLWQRTMDYGGDGGAESEFSQEPQVSPGM